MERRSPVVEGSAKKQMTRLVGSMQSAKRKSSVRSTSPPRSPHSSPPPRIQPLAKGELPAWMYDHLNPQRNHSPPSSPTGRSDGKFSPSGRSLAKSPVSLIDSFNARGNRCITRKVSDRELVDRAFHLAKKTGEVRIGKQDHELGDVGAKMVADEMEKHRSSLPILGELLHGAVRDVNAAAASGLKQHFGSIVQIPNKQQSVTVLTVCNHRIGKLGATALADALKGNMKLQTLNLDHNNIGAEGAATLCQALVSVHNLDTLHLGNNSIGPTFSEDLAHCTALTHLHLQHNFLTNVSIELGNHPSLIKLELTGNDGIQIPNADALIQEKHYAQLVNEEKSRLVKGKDNFSHRPHSPSHEQDGKRIRGDTLVNWSTTELRKFLIDIKLNMCTQEKYRNVKELDEAIPKTFEVKITLAPRWNKNDWEVDYINNLLYTHTSLQSLNGLQEWPAPPLALSPKWDLTNALMNPLYECNFIKNRLRISVCITELVLDKNDLRGRAAIEIAEALNTFHRLTKFSAKECTWDDSISELGRAVLQSEQMHTVNGVTLGNDTESWDLKGVVLNVVDVSFVVRMLTSKGPLGSLSSLDLRSNDMQHGLYCGGAVMIAAALSSVKNLSELNDLSLPKPPEISPRRFLKEEIVKVDVKPTPQPTTEDAEGAEPAIGSPFSALSGVSSPNSPGRVRIAEALDMRKRLLNGRVERDLPVATFGTLPVELTFFALTCRHRPLMVDLNFSENFMGDAGMPYMCIIIEELKFTLEKLHLNDNNITEKGATKLGSALARCETMKVLRLSNNPLGTHGVEAVLQGLAVNPTLQSLYLNDTKVGPFLPEDLYKLTQLDFIAMKDNAVIGERFVCGRRRGCGRVFWSSFFLCARVLTAHVSTGIPIDLLKLQRLATLWIDGNPIEFPPPPIPSWSFKRLIAWLRQVAYFRLTNSEISSCPQTATNFEINLCSRVQLVLRKHQRLTHKSQESRISRGRAHCLVRRQGASRGHTAILHRCE